MKMSAMLFKCLGDIKHLKINLGRCGEWRVEGRGAYKSSMLSVFYKTSSHRKLFKCKTLKTCTKLPQNDGKMLDKVP